MLFNIIIYYSLSLLLVNLKHWISLQNYSISDFLYIHTYSPWSVYACGTLLNLCSLICDHSDYMGYSNWVYWWAIGWYCVTLLTSQGYDHFLEVPSIFRGTIWYCAFWEFYIPLPSRWLKCHSTVLLSLHGVHILCAFTHQIATLLPSEVIGLASLDSFG